MAGFFDRKPPVSPVTVVDIVLKPVEEMIRQVNGTLRLGNKPVNIEALNVLSTLFAATKTVINDPKSMNLDSDDQSSSENPNEEQNNFGSRTLY